MAMCSERGAGIRMADRHFLPPLLQHFSHRPSVHFATRIPSRSASCVSIVVIVSLLLHPSTSDDGKIGHPSNDHNPHMLTH
jgi:hypothetical protein